MPFKPNYRFERFERERLKKAKKEEKARRRREEEGAQPGDADAGATEPPLPKDEPGRHLTTGGSTESSPQRCSRPSPRRTPERKSAPIVFFAPAPAGLEQRPDV